MYELQYEGSKCLRETSVEVTTFNTDELNTLIQSMADLMNRMNAYGLAAPQVGVNQRLFVISCSPYVMINPKIVSSSGSIKFREGCLSLPNVFLDITRPRIIEVEWYDRSGAKWIRKFEGQDSVVIQHELDHLDGKLFVDKVSSMVALLARKKAKQT